LLTTERSMERHNVVLGLGDRRYIVVAGLVGSYEGLY
jgi:hypothetical protein